MENLSNNKLNKKHSVLSVLKEIFNRDFVISAVIPVLIFSTFNKLDMTLKGVIFSGIWSISVIIINFIKEHKVNALATIAAVFSGSGLIVTVISKNPNYYLIAPIVQDILFASILFTSLLFKRPLIQIVVEQSYLKHAPEELKKREKYKSAWKILTILWGFLNISQAVLRMLLLHFSSMSTYYAVSTTYDNITSPLLIVFSIVFCKWYWKNREER